MIRLGCLLLAAVTGATALVYQVAWHKYLAVLLGSHGEATAAVLGIFLGGLSLGYALFGRISRRMVERSQAGSAATRLLVAYGGVEAAIGLYALLFPWLFAAARWVSLHAVVGQDLVAFAIDVLLTALLIGPPAVLMGATVPLLTQALARSLDDATRVHALIYAFNTAGAFAGALLGGFLLLPHFGLNPLVVAMGLINLAAGGLLAALGYAHSRASQVEPGAAPLDSAAPSATVRLAPWIAVAFLSGAAMMTLQVAFNRVAAFAFGSSPFTFSMVVATFVACLALGSFAVSALPQVPAWLLAGSQWALAGCLVLLYPALDDAPYWAHVVRSFFRDDRAAFYPFWLTVFVLLLCVLLIPLALSGALLPLLFDRLRRDTGTLGRVAGKIYGWNTVGSLCGALVGGYALLYWLDLHQIYRLAVLAVAAASALLTAAGARRRRAAAGTALAVAVIVLALLPPWHAERLASGVFFRRQPLPASYRGPTAFFADFLIEGQSVAFYEDGPVASISVIDFPYGDSKIHSLFSNGKNDGALPGDHPTNGLLALLPALFADRCERVFVIGFGTGKTVGEFAALDSTREVVVAEIARGVLHAAPLFEPYNEHALTNGKTRVIRSDAFRALRRTTGKFDVISSEPSNPWVTGVETLYSREFLEAARARLSAGGVYVQWIQRYDLDDRTLDLVLETFRRVFPANAIWHVANRDLLLLGFTDADHAVDLDRLLERQAQPDFRRAFARIGLSDLPSLLAHELLPVGTLAGAKLPDAEHTLLHPVLNHSAARAFFVGDDAHLPRALERAAAERGARQSLVRRVEARLPAEQLEPFRARLVEETCANHAKHCAVLFAQWQLEAPGSPLLAQTLERLRQTPAAPEIAPIVLSRLSTLFSASGTASAPADYDTVRHIVETFRDYYDHAAPFDPEALQGPLRRCTDPRCEALRAEAGDW